MNRALIIFVALVSAVGCSSADSTHEAPSEGGGADTSTAVKDSAALTKGGGDAEAADSEAKDGPRAPSDDMEDFGKAKDDGVTDAGDAGDGAVALTGKLKWAKGFGTTGNTASLSVAADPSGNIFASGIMTGTADFGGGALTCPTPDGGSAECAFLAKFDSSGSYDWAKVLSATAGTMNGSIVRTDGAGNVYMMGEFFGATNLGGGKVKSPAKKGGLYVAKYDTTGAYQWADAFSDSAATYDLASGRVDTAGNVFLSGDLKGSLDFGGGDVSAAGIYLVQLDTTGAFVWADTIATGSQIGVEPWDLALDSTGNILLGGQFTRWIDLGGKKLKSGVTSPSSNAFLAKFTSTGAYIWGEVFQDGLQDVLTGIATDSAGNVFVAGSFDGSVNLGSGDMPSAGGSDVFLAKLDDLGSGIWSASFGDANDQVGGAVAVDSDGDPTLTGGCYSGSIDFGGGSLTCDGGGSATSFFIATLTGAGVYSWAYTGGSTPSVAGGLAVAPSNTVLLTGSWGPGTLKVAHTSLPLSGVSDELVASFSP